MIMAPPTNSYRRVSTQDEAHGHLVEIDARYSE